MIVALARGKSRGDRRIVTVQVDEAHPCIHVKPIAIRLLER